MKKTTTKKQYLILKEESRDNLGNLKELEKMIKNKIKE
jgi:hypothetical protein